MRSPHDQRYPGPRAADWAVLAISLAFVAVGVLALPNRLDVALPTLAFFGVCAAVAAITIVRKRRFVALRPITVEISGGTPIRPSRTYLAVLAATLLGLGSVLLFYWYSAPILVVISLGVMISAGAVLAFGLVAGYLPVGFLQFDPAGLTIGRRRDTFTLPWDVIAAVRPGEFHDNAVLLLWIRDFEAVVVRPPAARKKVLGQLQTNLEWVGAHAMIMTSQYGIDLPLLVSAIERYVAEPSARAGLGVPRLPANVE